MPTHSVADQVIVTILRRARITKVEKRHIYTLVTNQVSERSFDPLGQVFRDSYEEATRLDWSAGFDRRLSRARKRTKPT